MKMVKFSIVTPCYDSVRTIRQTIESVLNQNYPALEHIVMDGGSTDGTLEILKEYPQLRWVSEKDEGHYHAMNKGIGRITGELVNILNADDCLRPGALKAVTAAFEAHPHWDAAFGDVVFVDSENKEIYRRQEAVYDFNVLRYSLDYICHQTLFVRKSVYDRIGTYHHKEFLNGCDYEFLLRLGREKCRVGHVPEFLIDYRYHDFGQSADLRIAENMMREGLRLRQAYGAPSGFPGKVLSHLFRMKRQFQKLIYTGKCDLIPGNWLLRKHMRKKTQFSTNRSDTILIE
jgi:glycosyltransferase involved in cell wall biosynthesis